MFWMGVGGGGGKREVEFMIRKEIRTRVMHICEFLMPSPALLLFVADFSIVVGVLFPMAVIFVVVAIVIWHQSPRRKQKKVQR